MIWADSSPEEQSQPEEEETETEYISPMLDNLKKADDPSPFPALTQLEVWGTNVCD